MAGITIKRSRPRLFILLILPLLTLAACSGVRYQPISEQVNRPALYDTVAFMADGYRLALDSYPADNAQAVVIALHGFNDYRRAFAPMCRYLASHRIHCYAYDQRGFGQTLYRGLWPANGELQRDLKEMIKLVSEEHPRLPLYVVGESMGGAVALTTFDEPSAPAVNGIALLAPAVWARHTQPWYQRFALWLGMQLTPGAKPTGEHFAVTISDNTRVLKALAQDPLIIKGTRVDTIHGLTNLMDQALAASKAQQVNGLVLYGANDELITKEPTCEMLANIADGQSRWRFVLYDNGYHLLSRDLQAENVYHDITQWIHQPAQALDRELNLDNGEWKEKYCGA